jgi:glycosyltransferase involved in cell wall biosynthesis
MKILYHHRIASKDGQYVHVEELTNALREIGHELLMVAPGFAEKSDFGSEGGIAARLKKALPQALYEILELGYSLVVAVKLVKAIRRFKPDFIYERYNLYQPAGVMVARLFRLPILLEVNAPLADERKKYSGLGIEWLARWSERYTWRHADKVLPVTAVLASIMEGQGVPKEKIEVIHNGINEHVMRGILAEGKPIKDALTIGFTGFIHPWHRLDLAIEAIARLGRKDVRLVCVGDGDIVPELKALAQERGVADQVEFAGLKNRQEVFEYVKNFDIALQPAVTPYASPLKLFEYMAAGALIIAPRTPNILEIVNEHCALMFEVGNSDDFTEKLEQAICEHQKLVNLRTASRIEIDKKGFTWQKNAARVSRLADGLIRKP